MRLPAYGLCLPCNYRRCRDGDTVEISLPGSDRRWAIRLIDCWAPETHEAGGPEAKAYIEQLLDRANGRLSVWIPAPRHVENLLRNLTFDRIPGRLFIGTDFDVSEAMVRAGHATADRPP